MSGSVTLHGGLVMSGDGADLVERDVHVVDGVIADAPADGAPRLDVRGRLLVPGLVNGHFHSSENWFKGRFDRLPLEPWMLYSYPAVLAPAQTPQEIELRTLLGAVELLRGGTTTVVDFLYELAGMTLETVAAVVDGYRRAGLRALVVLGVADLPWRETVVLDPGLVPGEAAAALDREAVPTWPEIEALLREAVARFHRPEEGLAIGLGPSGPQRCSDEMLAGCARLAEELGVLVHMHVLETPMQRHTGMRRWGTTLPRALDALGALGPAPTCFAHGIHLDDDDLPLLADRGVRVIHNPQSNLKLGSGVCRVGELRSLGVRVGLGTDGASSNDGNDMAATVKLAALLQRGPRVDVEDWLGADGAHAMGTHEGAAATPWTALGTLEPGAPADLLAFDLDHHAFVPRNHARRQLVYTAPSPAITDVVVRGRPVVAAGEIRTFDERAVLADARAAGAAITARFAGADRIGAQLHGALLAGWRSVMPRHDR